MQRLTWSLGLMIQVRRVKGQRMAVRPWMAVSPASLLKPKVRTWQSGFTPEHLATLAHGMSVRLRFRALLADCNYI